MEELKSTCLFSDPVLAAVVLLLLVKVSKDVIFCLNYFYCIPDPLPWIVSLPGGAEQSEASERPGGGQVSTPKEARPVSVSHQPGEGNLHLKVTTKAHNFFPSSFRGFS